MSERDAQGLAIAIICLLAVVYTVLYLVRCGVCHSREYKILRLVQAAIMLYIGFLYAIASVGLTSLIFGSGGAAMGYYRPGYLALIATVLIDAVWRYREA